MLPITRAAIEKTLRLMRKAGYLQYVPLDDRWHPPGKAAGALWKLAKEIINFQNPATDSREADRLIHDFSFDL